MSKPYTKQDYLRGNPSYNLALNERNLIIMALIKTDWNAKKAFRLNFPKPTIEIDAYRKIIKKHSIDLKGRTYEEISEMK